MGNAIIGWLALVEQTLKNMGAATVQRSTQRDNTVEATFANADQTENTLFVGNHLIYIENEAGVVAQYLPTPANLVRAVERTKVNA
jgi:hypothetical protein